MVWALTFATTVCMDPKTVAMVDRYAQPSKAGVVMQVLAGVGAATLFVSALRWAWPLLDRRDDDHFAAFVALAQANVDALTRASLTFAREGSGGGGHGDVAPDSAVIAAMGQAFFDAGRRAKMIFYSTRNPNAVR